MNLKRYQFNDTLLWTKKNPKFERRKWILVKMKKELDAFGLNWEINHEIEVSNASLSLMQSQWGLEPKVTYRATVSGSNNWGNRPSTIIKLWPPFVIFWKDSIASGNVFDKNVSISNRLHASCKISQTISFRGNTNSTYSSNVCCMCASSGSILRICCLG